ncbi:4-coumarate--CoA ligase-like 7 [Diachasma alloeum]|uniref:4-coumarate--CoA ligase-like 7 n=1 Tax=Diachasma alloeum TaxID=454923 RepID=UPI0007382DF4|nr:4-coumarate--CoA ligase-like 7 [Diachasma alloeum]
MLRLVMFHRIQVFANGKFIINPLLGKTDFRFDRLHFTNRFCTSKKKLSGKTTSDSVGSIIDEQNVFSSPFGDVEIPSGYLHQLIWRDIDTWWNKTAIVCAVSGRSYSYGELRKLSGRLATSLRQNNLRPGDTLAVVLPNIPEFVIVVLGASEAGVKFTLINPAYTVHEMNLQLKNSEAAAVITTKEKYSEIVESIKGQNSIRLPPMVVPSGTEPVPSGAINFRDLVNDRIEEFEKTGKHTGVDDKNDTALMPYSSGTTGVPKGVELTHRNIIANLTQMKHLEYNFAEPAIGEHQEIVPLFLPLYHLYGLGVCLLPYLSLGAKIICMPQFTSNNLLDVLEKYRTTLLYVAPPVVQLIANNSRFTKKHFEAIKCVTSAAAPIGMELITKFRSKIGTNLHFTQIYGLTETSPVITRSKYSVWNSAGLIAVNTQVRIVGRDDDKFGKNVGVNETGEIVVDGPQVMKGYYKNTKATEDCMDGKWLKTGDLGHIDDKGQLFVTGRLKELIKVKGFQVAPAELEDFIHGHEKIADVAVIGVPDEKLGEVPKAFIVPKPNVKISEEEIKKYVAERFSQHKHINQVQFIDAIPKSAAGKILRRELQKL